MVKEIVCPFGETEGIVGRCWWTGITWDAR